MIKKILLVTFLIIVLSRCEVRDSSQLNFNLSNENSMSRLDLEEIEIFVFREGVLTARHINAVRENNIVSLNRNDVIKSKIFLLSDPDQHIDYSNIKLGETSESDFLTLCTTVLDIENGDTITPFYVGIEDLTDTSDSDKNVNIERGVVQLNINIEVDLDMAIEYLRIKNVNVKSYAYSQSGDTIPDFKTMNFEKLFISESDRNTKYSFFLFEQKAAALEFELKVFGIEKPFNGKLPDDLNRNSIYDLNVSIINGIVKVDVVESGGEIEEGDDIELLPDFEYSKINLAKSELPPHIRVSKTLDTLFIPSHDARFKVAISSSSEIIVEAEGEIGVAPIFAEGEYRSTLYEITAKSRVNKTIAYLKITNKNLGNYYGDKIVMVLEASHLEWSGELSNNFHIDKYIDGDIGTLIVPRGVTVRIADYSKWLRAELEEGSTEKYIIKAGYRPNDIEADGRDQFSTIIIDHSIANHIVEETYVVSRKNLGLPVELINSTYWCKFNLKGNAINFADQIQINDPVSQIKDIYTYLKTCTDQEYMAIMGDGYKGINHTGFKFKYSTGHFHFEGLWAANHFGEIHLADPTKQCPTGYQIPHVTDFADVLGGGNIVNFPELVDGESSVTTGDRVFYKYERNNIEFDGSSVAKLILNKIESDGNPNFVLMGLGHQLEVNVIDFDVTILATINTTFLGWTCGNRIVTQDHWHRKSRTIRCIKTPGVFIY